MYWFNWLAIVIFCLWAIWLWIVIFYDDIKKYWIKKLNKGWENTLWGENPFLKENQYKYKFHTSKNGKIEIWLKPEFH